MRSPTKKQYLLIIALLLLFVMSLATAILTNGVYSTPQNKEIYPTSLNKPNFLIQLSKKTDFEHESTPLMAEVIYSKPSRFYNQVSYIPSSDLTRYYNKMSSSGAFGANIAWERKQTQRYFIEEQRAGVDAVIAGLINNDDMAIQAGFKMFDWGFTHQKGDGSFSGTRDAFHSTSFFVEAVARTILIIQQSPQAKRYASQVEHYIPLLSRAALWMIKPSVLKHGLKNNEGFTHRYYLVASALGLTGKLTGNQELIAYAQQSIKQGLSLQRSDGVNPEKGGHDSSYQAVGVLFSQRWLVNFPDDQLASQVRLMIDKALDWEATMILPSGEVSSLGNTRTGGQERNRVGRVKRVGSNFQFKAFAYWASVTENAKWQEIADRIARFVKKSS
jgi:hypothetical protein